MRRYDAAVRTTVDLPDDVHRAASRLARDRHQSLSRTVSDLLREALQGRPEGTQLQIDPVTGFPLFRVGRPISPEDVATALEDD